MVDFKKLAAMTPEERNAAQAEHELMLNNVRAEQRAMISDCLTRDTKLTEWEASFISSIDTQLEAGRFLSAKQEMVLDKVWTRVTK